MSSKKSSGCVSVILICIFAFVLWVTLDSDYNPTPSVSDQDKQYKYAITEIDDISFGNRVRIKASVVVDAGLSPEALTGTLEVAAKDAATRHRDKHGRSVDEVFVVAYKKGYYNLPSAGIGDYKDGKLDFKISPHYTHEPEFLAPDSWAKLTPKENGRFGIYREFGNTYDENRILWVDREIDAQIIEHKYYMMSYDDRAVGVTWYKVRYWYNGEPMTGWVEDGIAHADIKKAGN